MSIDAMKRALEALDCINSPLHVREINKIGEAIAALRAAIERAQEPAACQYAKDVSMPEYRCAVKCQYAQPAQQPLTDEEIRRIKLTVQGYTRQPFDVTAFARAIEAKLKEQNK